VELAATLGVRLPPNKEQLALAGETLAVLGPANALVPRSLSSGHQGVRVGRGGSSGLSFLAALTRSSVAANSGFAFAALAIHLSIFFWRRTDRAMARSNSIRSLLG
jgi:hypothetical protein